MPGLLYVSSSLYIMRMVVTHASAHPAAAPSGFSARLLLLRAAGTKTWALSAYSLGGEAFPTQCFERLL
jgi:hypothetical protein